MASKWPTIVVIIFMSIGAPPFMLGHPQKPENGESGGTLVPPPLKIEVTKVDQSSRYIVLELGYILFGTPAAPCPPYGAPSLISETVTDRRILISMNMWRIRRGK